MKRICISNQKGGVGKTTTSIMLAQELQRRGYRVLFVDTDPQCNSTNFYEAETIDHTTMIDVLCDNPKDVDYGDLVQHTKKGDIIAADPELSDAETMVKSDELRFLHLKLVLSRVEGNYDYIIFDTPPSIGVVLKNVLAYVDEIIIPVEESGWSMQGLINFADAIELAKLNNAPLTVAGILIVKSKGNTKKSTRMQGMAETLSEKLKTKVFETKIRESVRCTEALTEYYVPLYEYDSKNAVQADYEAFLDELGIVKKGS